MGMFGTGYLRRPRDDGPMRVQLMLGLLIAATLAGCADAPEPVLEEGPTPGSVHGVVVDETIRPLAGVEVVLRPGDRINVTGADGRFAFPDLESGVYTVTARLDGHTETEIVATVTEGVIGETINVVLPKDPTQQAFATAYSFKGMFECGVFPVACSNINILTWVVLGIGNVTQDRALFLQWIDGPPDFLQTELVWRSTQPAGDQLGFAIGGATEEQLSTGQATTHNYTFGESPIMLTIQDPELDESGIGSDRALLTQVVSAPAIGIPGGCVIYNPCGPGAQLMQPFESFTHVFYGYEPAADWRFSEDGAPTPP